MPSLGGEPVPAQAACGRCGATFAPATRRQRYCSARCRPSDRRNRDTAAPSDDELSPEAEAILRVLDRWLAAVRSRDASAERLAEEEFVRLAAEQGVPVRRRNSLADLQREQRTKG